MAAREKRGRSGHRRLAAAALSLSLVAGPALAAEPVEPAVVGLRIFPVGEGEPAGGVTGDLHAALRLIEGEGFVLRRLPLAAPAEDGGLTPEDQVQEDRARSLELSLEFREAAGVWAGLLEQVLSRPMLLLQPQQVARIQLALAAAQAEGGERELALLGFRTALALDANARLGPAYPPRARALFEEALQRGPLLPPTPRPALQRQVAQARSLEGIVWIALGRDQVGEVLLRGFTPRVSEVDLPEVRLTLPAEPAARRSVLRQEALALQRLLQRTFPGPTPATPWYRRGWVLATGGGLIVATTATILLARFLSPAQVDLVVQH
ncbi:MAG: hypothetical protein P1V51_03110 [Deltaproteobacteria bacterium]|nr:hypothetical protein [Deltaproteobacteria bacterium]